MARCRTPPATCREPRRHAPAWWRRTPSVTRSRSCWAATAAFVTRPLRPLLTVDLTSGSVPPSVSAGWVGMVDAVNLMSYGADWQEEIERHLAAGIPAEMINLGIGLTIRDSAPANVSARIDAALALGLNGVESWELGALAGADDPRLVAYRPLVE